MMLVPKIERVKNTIAPPPACWPHCFWAHKYHIALSLLKALRSELVRTRLGRRNPKAEDRPERETEVAVDEEVVDLVNRFNRASNG